MSRSIPVRFPVLLQLLIVLSVVPPAAGATYHVAQMHARASDTGPGDADFPFKSITRAATHAVAGDIVVIHAGIYRERVVVKASGTAGNPVRFQAATGEHVVVTGADRLTGWQKENDGGQIYSTAWLHKFISWNASMTHPDDQYHRVIGRCEQVAINNYLLRQVLSAEQLAPGTFFVDLINKTLRVWDMADRDLNKVFVEASSRQEIFRVEGDHVQLRGLHFRYAANMAQHGAIVLAGRYNTMEDCVIESMNSSGASFRGEDAVVRRCVFRENGQLGFGASRAHRLLFTESLVENNNTKNFDRGWEAGGNKLALCRDAVLERSRFLRNRGNGIWFDIGNTNCIVRQCLIADNEDAGIFYEISFTLKAHDNVIVRNGFGANPGAWGAQAGISLSSSPGCVIERNIIAANREGFNFREQLRTTPTIEERKERAVWNHDQQIRHNIIAFNRDAQIWGWFDVKDNRHWPSANQAKRDNLSKPAAQPENIAAPYLAKTADGHPEGLRLEELQLRFEKNIYYAAPGQGWFKWGPTWSRHQQFESLPEFQSILGIDSESRVLNPAFADFFQLDFRLEAGAIDSLKDSYPRGPVPGVMLGIK